MEILTVPQVAELLKLHEMTVYRLAKAGKLPGFKVGGQWRFRQDAMESWTVDRAQAARIEGESRNP